MIKSSIAIAFGLVFVLPHIAIGQTDPTAGPERFPQFRNLSGLAGSGYGVDISGNPSLSGPTALSTPVAHVLGHNHIQISGGKMSFSGSPELSSSNSNGTAFAAFGASFGHVNLAGSVMFLSDLGDNVFNLQAQYVPAQG